ncbi:MarR family winged helix-turn-helix transcriptional regulator [Massilia glaciei]|uniref:MarR family transcriptional regulator n=1 Tax=Massilia glaciei TaxID=1524097 RepID=A0A2U2HM18_9BURK|nr:MarR family winged helix-turn-helix transcriptional regulator [Massilia glaciei]PWF48519.1 MarR family transcriptional regulator [Massilia glaciei]
MGTSDQPATGHGADAALDFCVRMARAQAVLGRRLDNTLGSVHGIGFGDYVLLHHLSRAAGGRLRRVDLAERLALTASGVTRTLLPLEKIGLVARQSDPRDARVGYAVITGAGQTLLGEATTTARGICQESLGGATPGQLDALGLVLGQIAGMNLSNS